MNKIRLRNSKQKLSGKEILDFESKIGHSLPLNYKLFISMFNGGLVEDNDDIKLFLSIKHGKNTVEYIRDAHQVIENNIPSEYLPIATDWSGNPITICLKAGNDSGKIVIFSLDTDNEPETIAASLEELLGVNDVSEL